MGSVKWTHWVKSPTKFQILLVIYEKGASKLYQSQQLNNKGHLYPKFVWKITLKLHHKSISKNRIKSFINQLENLRLSQGNIWACGIPTLIISSY